MFFKFCYGKSSSPQLCTGACLHCEANKIDCTTFEDVIKNAVVFTLAHNDFCNRDEVKEKKTMKYIIDVTPIEGTNLFRAEGFKTLVFDLEGLRKLTPVESELKEGCLVRTPNGKTLYEFVSKTNDGYLNCINKDNGKFVCLAGSKYIVVG